MRASEVELGDIKLLASIDNQRLPPDDIHRPPAASVLPFSQTDESPFAPSAEESQKPEEETVISYILAKPDMSL